MSVISIRSILLLLYEFGPIFFIQVYAAAVSSTSQPIYSPCLSLARPFALRIVLGSRTWYQGLPWNVHLESVLHAKKCDLLDLELFASIGVFRVPRTCAFSSKTIFSNSVLLPLSITVVRPPISQLFAIARLSGGAPVGSIIGSSTSLYQRPTSTATARSQRTLTKSRRL